MGAPSPALAIEAPARAKVTMAWKVSMLIVGPVEQSEMLQIVETINTIKVVMIE